MMSTKLSILCVLEILTTYSDEQHILNANDIRTLIKHNYDILLDRKTIYRNISYLNEFGYDISTFEENKQGFYLRERKFETSEITLLIDAVASSKFVTNKETNELIAKLQSFNSIYQQKILKDIGIHKTNTKTLNKDVFYNIEVIQKAIKESKKVEFTYCTYNFDKKLVPRRNEKYVINPYGIICANESYYLICNYDKYDNVSNYRLDYIKDIAILDEERKIVDKNLNIENYGKNAIFMFGGEEKKITLLCESTILKDVIDKFGDNVTIERVNDNQFKAVVSADINGMEFWVMQYLNYCEVITPTELRETIKDNLISNLKKYEN